MIEREKIEQISIRGRVAFAILCLELAIKHFKLETLNWKFLLGLLWSYTNSNVGRWHEVLSECIPNSVLVDDFVKEEMELLTEDQFNELRELFNTSNDVINQIINQIFWIATEDLYSSISNYSQGTIDTLLKILKEMDKYEIDTPDIQLFTELTIEENDGWGREFKREDVMG